MPHNLQNKKISYRNLFETMAQGVVYQNSKGEIISANKAAEEILGLTYDQMTGRSSMDPRWKAIHQDGSDFPGEDHPAMVALRTGKNIKNVTMGIFNPEKKTFQWININAVPEFRKGEQIPYQVYTTFEDITERKKVEELLKESEEKYKLIAETSQTGIYIHQDDTIVYANDKFAEIHGYTIAELTGTKYSNLFHPDERDRALAIKASRLRGDKDTPQYYEARRVKKDGGIIWCQTFAVRIEYLGKPAILGNLVDISERKQAEQRLQESKERYRLLFNNTNDAVFVHQPTADENPGKFIEVNDIACQVYGYKKENLLELSPVDLMPAPHDKKAKVFLENVLTKGRHIFETVHRSNDGKIFPVEISAYLFDFQGTPTVLSIVRDITERKEAEAALRSSHERFITLLDSIDATIYVADMETYEVLYMNKNMIDSFGKDLTGEICWDAFRREKGQCPHCTNDRLLDNNGKPAGVSVWHDRNPVTGKWYVNYDRAIEWTDGRIVRLQIATDITKLKLMEQQLQQAQKMEAIGTLAGGIAHDFNNILSAIIGYTELAQIKLEPDSEIQKDLNSVLVASGRAKDLIKQILTFSRQAQKEPMPVQTVLVVKEALKLIRSSIPVTIDIRQNLQSQSVIVSDPTLLHQVVMNLCTNAAHAMREKGGILEVDLSDVELDSNYCSFHPEIQPGVYQKLTVSDTGHGMAPDVLRQIFDPFFTTKPKDEGTGLGLSVVHGIVKDCGGTITVDSEPGRGTTFKLYFPITDDNAGDKSEKSGVLPTGTEHLLYVDDEKMIVDIAKVLLLSLGYTVEVRTSSLEALEVFKAAPDKFDLVVTDMTMPNMTGDMLAKELMKIRPNIPVIICTGFSEKINEAKAKELGIKDLLMKPLLREEMALTIRKVLDGAKLREQGL